MCERFSLAIVAHTMARVVCVLLFIASPVLCFLATPLSACQRLRCCAVRMRGADEGGDSNQGGIGFGTPRSYEAEEERGRKALEALRAASAETGYDTSLQGLQTTDDGEEVEVPQEFKSTVTLGFAGFLILVGVVSLVFGGPVWESNTDSSTAKDAAVEQQSTAFGFVPRQLEPEKLAPPTEPGASWATVSDQ